MEAVMRGFGVRVLVAALLALLCFSCKRQLEIDDKRFAAEVNRRASATIETPEVNAAFDRFANTLLADPSLSPAGEELMTALGSDPSLAPGFQAVTGEIGKQPAMLALVKKLQRENPRANANEIGALAGKHVETVTQNPIFGRAFERAFQGVLTHPDVAAKLARFGDALATDGILMAKVNSLFMTGTTEEKWRKRLTELNGGSFPDKERATQLLLDHAVSNERLKRFYIDLTALPVLKRELATALRDIARAPSFRRHLVECIRQCVDDESFRRNAVAALNPLLGATPTEDELYQEFRHLLETPVVARSMATMLDRMLGDPELGVIGKRAVRVIVADPALQALVVGLFERF
jgi:hypothetical protein